MAAARDMVDSEAGSTVGVPIDLFLESIHFLPLNTALNLTSYIGRALSQRMLPNKTYY
jgi:hypothetical protein